MLDVPDLFLSLPIFSLKQKCKKYTIEKRRQPCKKEGKKYGKVKLLLYI